MKIEIILKKSFQIGGLNRKKSKKSAPYLCYSDCPSTFSLLSFAFTLRCREERYPLGKVAYTKNLSMGE